jgi:Tfp pilus assembly protein PilV
MKSFSNKNLLGFSLIETLAALGILAVTSATMFVVIDRAVDATANMTMQRKAFEVARENMEKILAGSTATENSEFGITDRYPNIEWHTATESFYEPITSQMWVRAVSTADYYDTDDKQQSIEFTHWLTNLSQKEIQKMLTDDEKDETDDTKTDKTDTEGTGDEDEPGKEKILKQFPPCESLDREDCMELLQHIDEYENGFAQWMSCCMPKVFGG